MKAMGLGKSVEKLDKYQKRLNSGKARKIKPEHVEKIIRKLEAKEKLLLADIEATDKESKKERLRKKLELLREQKSRAHWLHDEIAGD